MKCDQTDNFGSEPLLHLEKDGVYFAPDDNGIRSWHWFDYASVWSGIVICVSGYSIGALLVIKLRLTIQQALMVLVVCGFVAFLLSLLTAAPGFHHKANTVSFLYNIFGNKGVMIPVAVRLLVCCGWFGIHSLFGGMTIHLILCTAFSSWSQLGGVGETIGYLLFVSMNLILFRHGFESIRKLQCLCAPLLMAVGVFLLVWANSKINFTSLLVAQTEPASVRNVIQAAVIVCGSWFSFTFFMSDFSRFSRSKADYMIGQFIGFYLSKLLFGGFGVLLGTASVEIMGSYSIDMVSLVNEIEQPITKIMALVVVFLATLTTTIAACLAISTLDLVSVVCIKLERQSAAMVTTLLATLVVLPELFCKIEIIQYDGLATLLSDFLKVYSSIINGLIMIFLFHCYVFNEDLGRGSKDYHWFECALCVLLIAITLGSYLSKDYNFICLYSGFTNILLITILYGLYNLNQKSKRFMCAR